MEQGPAAQHDPARPASTRARITAAVRDDAGGRGTAPPVPAPGAADEPPPRLPAEEGLEPVRRLGRECWLVREVRSGERFVLRLCGGPQEPGGTARGAAERALAVDLAGLDDPHVVAVRGLLGPAAAPLGLVEDFLAGGSLADRLAGRGRLDPAELAPVLREAAAGLAVLHGVGRCAAGLTARRILFRTAGPAASVDPAGAAACAGPAGPVGDARSDGSGGAAGVPVAAVRAGTGPGSPQDDVRDLGVVGWRALTGREPAADDRRVSLALLRPDAPPGLVRAVEAALAVDPPARPTAAELAARLEALGKPGPAPGAAGSSGHRTGRRGASASAARAGASSAGRTSRATGRPAPRAAALLAGALLLLAAGAAARGAAGNPEPPPPPAATASRGPAVPSSAASPGAPSPDAAPGEDPHGGAPPDRALSEDPRVALDALVARRGEALRTGAAGLLDQVYAPGAEAAAADREVIARTAGAGAFDDLVLEVGRARRLPPPSETQEPGTVAFVAEVRVDGYRGDPGADPSVAPAGNGWTQTVAVVLADGASGWRVVSVVPSAGGAAAGTGPATEDPRG